MSRDGSGNYSRVQGPYQDGQVIDDDQINAELDDMATALTGSWTRDGTAVPTANIPMANRKFTGMAAGTANGDSVRYEQLVAAMEASGYQNFETVYGAVGDGSTNNTTAWQNACNAGLPLVVPPGDFRIQGLGTVDTNGMIIKGVGAQSIIRPVGSFNAIEINGGIEGARIEDLHFEAASHTGYLIEIQNANRTTIKGLTADSPYNGVYIEQANMTTLRDLWMQNFRGAYMFHCYGTPALRSDVVKFENVVASADSGVAAASRAVGLMWDGNVHTVSCNGLYLILPSKGLHMRASAGGTTFPTDTPAFGRFTDLEIDYPAIEGITLDSAWDVQFVNLYCSNSIAEEGINIGSSAVQGSIVGGFVSGNAKEGMVFGGKDWQFSGVNFVSNSFLTANLGSYDHVRCTSTCERAVFAGCHAGMREGIGEVTRYGLRLDSGATYVSWSGGFLGGLLAEWSDASAVGTNSHFSVTAINARLSVVNNMLMGTAIGFDAAATPTIGGGIITGITITNGGRHYSSAPSVFAFDPNGTGSGFSGTAVVSSAGVVTSVTIGAGGTNYSSATIIYFQAQSGSPMIRPYSPTVSNVIQQIGGKGTGAVLILNDQGPIFAADGGTATVNYIQVNSAASGTSPMISSQGSGTNLDLRLIPKGTGVLSIGAPTRTASGTQIGWIDVLINGATGCIPYYAR